MTKSKKMSLFKELRRRHVFRVSAAYLVVAWLSIEVTGVLTDTYNAPDWILQVFIALLALGLPITVVLAWAFDLTPQGIVHDRGTAIQETQSEARNPLHDSSIAVLPLDYYGEKDNEYIAEGITEDLTTLLSRTPGLFVIARNSSSRYRGGDVSIRKAGEELGVRYVTEGSVRRIGDQLRVNIQLIEATSENHIWAQRFDFAESELYQNEEDICHRVSTQLVSSLGKAESDRARLMPSGTQDSWLLTQQAIHMWWSGPDEETADKAFQLISEALEKDPEYTYALAFHGFLCIISLMIGINRDINQLKEKGLASIQAALKSAPDDPFVLCYWGIIQGFTGNLQHAISSLKRAREGNPNDPHINADLGFFLIQSGRRQEGVNLINNAFRLSPYEPRSYVWHLYLGSALGMSDVPAALEEYEKSLALFNRYIPALVGKIICFGLLEREDEAISTAKQLQDFHPQVKLADLNRMCAMSINHKDHLATILEQLKRYVIDVDE